MYCKYCGTEIKEDEKFCGNCGKLAVEENVTVSPKEKVNVENFKGYISEILTVLKNIFKEPVTTTENAPNLLKKQSSFILIGILSVLYGLLNIWAIKAATNASLSLLSAFGNNLDMFGYGNMFGFKMPYGKIFIAMVFLMIVSIAAIFLANFLFGKYVFKKQVQPLNLVKIVVVSVIPYFLAFFIQILLNYITPVLGMIVLFIGSLISIICLFNGMKNELELSKDKMAYLTPFSYLVMFLFDYLILKILINSIANSISNLLY